MPRSWGVGCTDAALGLDGCMVFSFSSVAVGFGPLSSRFIKERGACPSHPSYFAGPESPPWTLHPWAQRLLGMKVGPGPWAQGRALPVW